MILRKQKKWEMLFNKIKTNKIQVAEYGPREPEFIEMDDTFRINLYRNTSGANGANTDANGANTDAS